MRKAIDIKILIDCVHRTLGHENMNQAQTLRYDMETLRRLNRAIDKKSAASELPLVVGTAVICKLLNLTHNGLMRRVRAGTWPPPLKGIEPCHGESYAVWKRTRSKWPMSLVRMAIAGGFGEDTPITPSGWMSEIEGWRS